MKILLINPPVYTYNGVQNAQSYPPGIYNVATFYRQCGHDVEMFDMYPELAFTDRTKTIGDVLHYDGIPVIQYRNVMHPCGNYEKEKMVKGQLHVGLPYSELEKKLKSDKYNMIFVQCTFTYLYESAFEVLRICRMIQQYAEVRIGGTYARLCTEHAKKSAAHNIIDYRIPEADFIATDMSFFAYKPYRISIPSALGCANSCGYCAVGSLEGHERRERTIDSIISDLESKIALGYTRFKFLDSDLLGNWDGHMKPLLTEIVKRGLNVDLTNYGGIESGPLTEDQLMLMRDAGFKKIVIPLECADTQLLRTWNRPNTLDMWKKAISTAKKVYPSGGVGSFVMIGYPGQTHEAATKSIDLCKEYGSTPILLPFTPIPGTSLEDTSGRDLADLHPLLWPYAWDGLTVAQIEDLFGKHTDWCSKSAFKYDSATLARRVMTTSPAIPK